MKRPLNLHWNLAQRPRDLENRSKIETACAQASQAEDLAPYVYMRIQNCPHTSPLSGGYKRHITIRVKTARQVDESTHYVGHIEVDDQTKYTGRHKIFIDREKDDQ
jgi:hypothetical protein